MFSFQLIEFLWTLHDDNELLEIRGNGKEVHCKTNGLQSIKTNMPIPREDKFYFEVLILNSGENGIVGVGICRKNYPVNEMPGWGPLSIGYHSDDGGVFVESRSQGITYYTNETFTTGDHIGILIDYSKSTIKISKEEFQSKKKEVKKLQLKSHFMSKDLYPCVGFKDFNGGSLRLVAAKTGNQKFYLSKFPIAIEKFSYWAKGIFFFHLSKYSFFAPSYWF